MTNYVVWLDSAKAKIFALKPTGIEKSHLEKSGSDHHTHNKKDHHGEPASEHFYRDLSVRLKDAKQLFIIGDGHAKDHFKTHLETHHGGDLAKKIIGMEDSEQITDNQILAASRKFFKNYDLFNDPVNLEEN